MKALDQFLSEQNSEYTKRSYRWLLSRLIAWMEDEDIEPSELTPTLFCEWLNNQNWNKNTRRQAACAVRAFYRWLFGKHPAVQIPLHRVKSDPQRVLSEKKVVRLVEAATHSRNKVSHARDQAIVYLMMDTGLRAFEICHLETRFLDLDELSLRVICKGGDWETACFSETTAEKLSVWLDFRKRFERRFSLPPEVFFSFKTGRRLTPGGLRDMFYRLGERAGIEVSPHDLRRTFAHLAIRSGAPTRILMAAGRWHQLATVEIYTAQIRPEDFRPYFPMQKVDKMRL